MRQFCALAALSLGYAFSRVNKPESLRDIYGLRYAELLVALVTAAQEQQEQIEALTWEMEGMDTSNSKESSAIISINGYLRPGTFSR